jgi:hypothetical protein
MPLSNIRLIASLLSANGRLEALACRNITCNGSLRSALTNGVCSCSGAKASLKYVTETVANGGMRIEPKRPSA